MVGRRLAPESRATNAGTGLAGHLTPARRRGYRLHLRMRETAESKATTSVPTRLFDNRDQAIEFLLPAFGFT